MSSGGGIAGYNYSAAVMLALCKGSTLGVGNAWSNKDRVVLSDLGASLGFGSILQDPWGYLETKHPDQVAHYPGIAWVGVPALYLGRDQAQLPNLSFEVYGRGMQKTILDPGGAPIWTSATNWFSIPAGSDGESGYVYPSITLVSFDGARVGLQMKLEFTPSPLTASINVGGSTFAITAGVAFDISAEAVTQITLNGDGITPIDVTSIEIATQLTPEAAIYQSSVPGKLDADPADVVLDFLTNPIDGAGLDPSLLGDLSTYSDYCRSANLLISPAFQEQRTAADYLGDILTATNSEIIPSQGILKIIPYGDQAIGGNGSTFTPDMTPLYSFTDDHYIVAPGDDPVLGTRQTSADAFNHVQVEFLNRAKDYNVEIAERKDQADIETIINGIKKGVRTKDTVQLHAICDADIAGDVAQLLLQRTLYVRNTYQFNLSWAYCLLEPMDLVALTDEALGLDSSLCRITEIDEADDDFLTFTVEELVPGIGTAETYGGQLASGYLGDATADPGSVTLSTIFEPPGALCAAPERPEVWVAATGGANWGGCEVWISTNGETFASIGFLYGKSRIGVLSADLPSHTSPDTVDTLNVDVTDSGATIYPGTQSDADNLQTLCYVGNELLAYRDAVLTGPYQYALSYLVRGAYGSTISAHLAGVPFVRLDSLVLKTTYPAILVGQAVTIKLASFNLYGKNQQSLADAATFTYTLTGESIAGTPHTESGAAVATSATVDTTISYVQPFGTAPALNVTITDQVAGDTLVFTSQTVEGASFHITNGGAQVARTVNWIAQGV